MTDSKTDKKTTFDELSPDEKLIESARLRTNAFAKAIDSYNRDTFDFPRESFEGTNLPSWNNINNASSNFINNIKAFTELLDPQTDEERQRIVMTETSRRGFLENASVFPNAKFPYEKGYGNEITLFELLRRRPDPAVSAWEQKMQSVGKELEDGTVIGGKRVHGQDWEDLWNWAAFTAQDLMRGSGGVGDEEEEDEDEEDEDEEDSGDVGMTDAWGKSPALGPGEAPMPLEYVLSYMSSGYIPPEASQNAPISR